MPDQVPSVSAPTASRAGDLLRQKDAKDSIFVSAFTQDPDTDWFTKNFCGLDPASFRPKYRNPQWQQLRYFEGPGRPAAQPIHSPGPPLHGH